MNYKTDKTVEKSIELARDAMTFLILQLDFDQFLCLLSAVEYAYQNYGLLLDEHNHR